MLSILIPSYHFNTYPLVKELYTQCTTLNITFEILVQDDASGIHYDNFLINGLDCCSYTSSVKNNGSATTRNLLVKKAVHEWILFLDCDVLPASENFIQHYITNIPHKPAIVFGGIAYYNQKPLRDEMLRWVYGKKREEKSAAKRQAQNASHFLCSNVLLHQSVFRKVMFDEDIVQYGYEDLLFSKKTEACHFPVIQTDNPAYHLKLEKSRQYLQKTETALHVLHTLIAENKLQYNDTGITRLYGILKKLNVISLFNFVLRKLKIQTLLQKNLLSDKPSIRAFDLYRLGYFMSLNKTSQ